MPFKDRLVVGLGGGPIPGKFYFHTNGRDAYGMYESSQVMGAMEHLREALRQTGEPRELFYKDWEFMVGAMWGDRGQRVMDVFGATEKEILSGNPEIEGWVVREGVARREKGISCLEGLGLAVAEFRLRVNSDSLLAYLQADMPKLPFVSGDTHVIRM